MRARIVGTKNIAKITKSMKMVSAAKLRGDNARLAAADPFSVRSSFGCVWQQIPFRFDLAMFHLFFFMI